MNTKNLFKVLVSALLLILNFQFLKAQEMLGIVNSNYSGNIGMQINPANVVGSPYSREYNIFAMDFSVENNYIYIPAGQLYNPANSGSSHGNRRDFYTEEPDKKAYSNIYLKGPAIFMSGKKNGFAIHSAFRTNFSANDVNYHLAKFIWDGFDYSPQHGIEYKTSPYKAAGISFYELGVTYGVSLIDKSNSYLTAAATISIDAGTNGVYVTNKNMDYIVPNFDLLIVHNLNAEYAHTITSPTIGAKEILSPKGWGGGLNIGVNYTLNRNEGAYRNSKGRQEKYTFKVGASILDLGAIKMTSDAQVYKFVNDSTYWPGIDTTEFVNLPTIDSLINTQFTGSQYGGLINTKFTVGLPTAISLQFDYAIMPGFYANLTVVQRIPFMKVQVRRGNQIALTPRYETAIFEISLPYTIFEYNQHRLGLAFRYKWFFAGTETMLDYADLVNITGIDFYLGIKLSSKNQQRKSGTVEDCFHGF